MNESFGSGYAGAYDLLYESKAYDAECDLIEKIFRTHGEHPIRSVLDFGCGTGSHAMLLAQRGYEMVGVDLSESMIALARDKLSHAAAKANTSFEQGDIRSCDLARRFDAVLILFAVLGYQVHNVDVLATLENARRHLEPGGLLLFDVWYGPAVLRERPSQRVKEIQTPDGRVLRAASGTLDTARHLCEVEYHLWRLNGEGITAEVRETHRMRFFFPQELELFLKCTGFSCLRLGCFPEIDRDPDERTWNVMCVARASGSGRSV